MHFRVRDTQKRSAPASRAQAEASKHLAPVRSTSAGSRSRPSASAPQAAFSAWISEPARSATTAIPRASRPLCPGLTSPEPGMLLDWLLRRFADEPDQLLGPAQQPRDIGRLDGEKPKPVRTQGRDSLALDASLREKRIPRAIQESDDGTFRPDPMKVTPARRGPSARLRSQYRGPRVAGRLTGSSPDLASELASPSDEGMIC